MIGRKNDDEGAALVVACSKSSVDEIRSQRFCLIVHVLTDIESVFYDCFPFDEHKVMQLPLSRPNGIEKFRSKSNFNRPPAADTYFRTYILQL